MTPLRRAAAIALFAYLAFACARAPAPAAPSKPVEQGASPLPARKIRVRAYADDAYRAQNPGWEERVKQLLARASDVTGRRFNATFELADTRAWDSNPPTSELPASLLRKLEALDPGRDVDLVLGFASSLPAPTVVQESLGLARALGHHAVLRGLAGPAEDGALRESLKEYPAQQRQAIFAQRRSHKEISVLLHHWGHTLGAPHSGQGLMHDAYDRAESFFTLDSLAVLSIGLLQKPPGLDDPEVRAAWARDMEGWLASDSGKALDPGARTYLAALVAAGSAEPEAVMSLADHDQMKRAVQEDQAGRHEEAAALLRPLLERHPRQARLHAVACQVQIHSGSSGDETWALCRRAAELDPKSPSAALFAADLADRRKDPSAGEALARAREVLEQLKDAPPDHWLYLAGLHRHRDEVSLTESALDRAGLQASTAELREWVLRTRRWVGLVPGAVPLEREGAYVGGFRQAKLDLEAARYSRAREEITALEKDFGGAVGALTLRCELQIRQASSPSNLRECRLALERYGESVHAQYLLGMALSTRAVWRDAVAALERVVELDPTIADAWSQLSAAYRASGNARAADALRDRYRQRFGKPPTFK
ncbi:MAG TPA: hypothetical protein VIG99_00350 [Myxococcaceae bacterium]|jgi:tetratricopeptide (TPR) repeat protein